MIAQGNQTTGAIQARDECDERDDSANPAIPPSPVADGGGAERSEAEGVSSSVIDGAALREAHALASPHTPDESTGSPPAPSLTDFVQLNYNLRALAHKHHRSQLDLLDWLNSQPIRHKLAELEHALSLALALRTLEARRTAIDALEQIAADQAADPTQRRRAATALLHPLSSHTSPLRKQSVPPHPRAADAHAHRIDGIPSRPPKARGSQPPGSSPRLDSPTLTIADCPLPPTTPDALINTALESICEGNPPGQALAALHAHFAQNATLNDQPVPDSPDGFDDDARHNLLGCVQYLIQSETIEDERAEHTILFVHYGGRCVRVTIASARFPDHTWRITALKAEPIDSS